MPNGNPYETLFARHRSARVPTLWGWQSEVLAANATVGGDAAVELPTGTGKTLIGLLAGEHFRDTDGAPVAYLAGNKQLAQQVERQARDQEEIGVAIEMEDWEIYNDLLKFRRGYERGQIGAGVILQPHYATLRYCYEHMLKLNEPLVGHIPILFVCPRGPGLKEPVPAKSRTFSPYRMPKKRS